MNKPDINAELAPDSDLIETYKGDYASSMLSKLRRESSDADDKSHGKKAPPLSPVIKFGQKLRERIVPFKYETEQQKFDRIVKQVTGSYQQEIKDIIDRRAHGYEYKNGNVDKKKELGKQALYAMNEMFFKGFHPDKGRETSASLFHTVRIDPDSIKDERFLHFDKRYVRLIDKDSYKNYTYAPPQEDEFQEDTFDIPIPREKIIHSLRFHLTVYEYLHMLRSKNELSEDEYERIDIPSLLQHIAQSVEQVYEAAIHRIDREFKTRYVPSLSDKKKRN